ncbi:MAG: ketosteroid isomerase-like protein [Cyclobacteriaceae bacterium]|jgi:ketosteroid isomerase-like protein
MAQNQSIIQSFYSSFQNKDAKTMCALYHDEASFQDPAFGLLNVDQIRGMWTMLITRGGKDLKLEFEIIREDDTSGEAIWQAWYVFSKTKRPVHNVIKASFEFKDGKIIKHEDQFDFWKWSRMALGTPGILLGWTSYLQKKVSIESHKLLNRFMDSPKTN